MKKLYKGLVKKTFSIIGRAIESGKSITKTEEDIRRYVKSVPELTKSEQYSLYKIAMMTFRQSRASYNWEKQLAKRETYDNVLRVCRRIQSRVMLREKKEAHRAQMQSGKYIFYLCSEHNNCADDHKAYQGKIYVDRFWRNKVEDIVAVQVLDYIKTNEIKTVQEIMDKPVYLTTRPYCRHYFIPLKTVTVLTQTEENILEQHRAYKREKMYTEKEYYETRSEVYIELNKIAPCQYFEKKARSRF